MRENEILKEYQTEKLKPIKENIKVEVRRTRVIFPMELRKKLLKQLRNKYNDCCSYCRSPLGVTDEGDISHFLPKSIYPELVYDINNLVLSCNYCNKIKGSKTVLDKEGNEFIINPNKDIYEEHIKIGLNGTLIGISKKGNNTIEFFQLNRKPLIDSRISRAVHNLSKDDSYSVIEPILNKRDLYDSFRESIENIDGLLLISIENENSLKYFYAMLYANVITVMETYLSDAFITTVITKGEYLRGFVETFHDYSNEKFDYQKIFQEFEKVEEKATKAMLDVIYHNVSKVRGMYKDTLGVIFPSNLKDIYLAVDIRHDIVHRNGKNKKNEKHSIGKKDVELLMQRVIEFVDNIEVQINNL